MNRINWGRVSLGGVLGGIVVLVVDIVVNGFLFGNQWRAAYETIGHPLQASGLIVLAGWSLLVGISGAWLYAAIRPRFGPGPATAIKSGIALWVFAYVLAAIGLLSLQVFPPRLPIISAVGGIAEAVLGSLVAGAFYRE